MKGRPLLLLDVDGVLCPIGDRSETLVSIGASHLRYEEETPQRLRSLVDHFVLVWATSWEEEANEVVGPALGLPLLPVVRFGHWDPPQGVTWKLPAIQQYVGERACAWVDDDIGRDAHAWARARGIPTRFLEIRGDRGLSQDDVEELIAFATALEDRPA